MTTYELTVRRYATFYSKRATTTRKVVHVETADLSEIVTAAGISGDLTVKDTPDDTIIINVDEMVEWGWVGTVEVEVGNDKGTHLFVDVRQVDQATLDRENAQRERAKQIREWNRQQKKIHEEKIRKFGVAAVLIS